VALVGRITGLAGGALVIVGSFLNYIDSSFLKGTFWKLAHRLDVIVLVLVLLAAAALAMGLVTTTPRGVAAVAAAFAGAVFGLVSPLDARSFNDFGAGMWLMSIAALVMTAGAVIAALAPNGAAAGAAATGGGLGGAAAPPAGPPPGWYADPSGQGGERYWSGTAWSDQTR
jgi:Protein of unknown function (DUF2510)